MDMCVACICSHARCCPVDLTCDTSRDNVVKDFGVMTLSGGPWTGPVDARWGRPQRHRASEGSGLSRANLLSFPADRVKGPLSVTAALRMKL